MGKHAAGTPKAIANAIKSKGLQKLRFYCEMCQKQCRDENGFKCHILSETHQRQMQVFAENPDAFVDRYSQEFEETFMDLVRRRYRTVKVKANNVYQDFISDRYHVHMNATQWTTLTDFILYLGKTGKCVVDKEEEGLYITYIDEEARKRREAVEKKLMMEKTDAQRTMKMLEQQIQAARAVSGEDDLSAARASELQRSEDEKIKLGFDKTPLPLSRNSSNASSSISRPPVSSANSSAFFGSADHDDTESADTAQLTQQQQRKRNALDALIEENETRKRSAIAHSRSESQIASSWLSKGLVVKVKHRDLAKGRYHKKKGVVIKTEGEGKIAEIKMSDSGDVLKLADKYLETVIPKEGNSIRIVKGPLRGSEGILRKILVDEFKALVELHNGETSGFEYDQVCKFK